MTTPSAEIPVVQPEKGRLLLSNSSPWPLTIGLTIALIGAVATGVSLYKDQEAAIAGQATEIASLKVAVAKLEAADQVSANERAQTKIEVATMRADLSFIKESVRRIEDAVARQRRSPRRAPPRRRARARERRRVAA